MMKFIQGELLSSSKQIKGKLSYVTGNFATVKDINLDITANFSKDAYTSTVL